MLEAIAHIQSFTAEMTFASFQTNPLVQSGVAWQFQVLGEAAGQVERAIQQQYPAVPWRTMRDMRNVISHGYHSIDPAIMWQTLSVDLAPVMPLLREILAREGQAESD